MAYKLAADLVVMIHLGFIGFVLLGGLLALKWRWVLLVHLPAVLWGVLLEFRGWICPLTPLEQQLRQSAGMSGYTGGFIDHYILPIIYPEGLTHELQMVFGGIVIIINTAVYGCIVMKLMQRKKAGMQG